MSLRLSQSERATVAQADAIKRRARQRDKAARPPKVAPLRVDGQRDPRERDAAFLSWLHAEGLPCFACEVEGCPASVGPNPLEAAHQKLAIASRGWSLAGKGSRGHDRRAVILCRWHHQLAPNACDKAQRKFWDRLGLGDAIADLCDALHATFRAQEPGRPVLARFVALARGAR